MSQQEDEGETEPAELKASLLHVRTSVKLELNNRFWQLITLTTPFRDLLKGPALQGFRASPGRCDAKSRDRKAMICDTLTITNGLLRISQQKFCMGKKICPIPTQCA